MKVTAFLLAFWSFCLPLLADQVSYKSGERRDPFLPLIGPNGVLTRRQSSALSVEGIIFDPNGSLVLVNGEFYKEGDVIGDATVVNIYKDRVVFKQEDEEKTLWIRDESSSGGKANETVVDASAAKA